MNVLLSGSSSLFPEKRDDFKRGREREGKTTDTDGSWRHSRRFV
jgi:hypothetical protein